MELVALLRVLWRYRIAVALGFVVALALGFMATRGASTRFGVASANVIVDTPQSQLVDADPPGAPSLGWRAALLADLMETDAMRLRIARELRLQPDGLVMTARYQDEATIPVPLPRHAVEAAAAAADRKPYELTIQPVDPLPIIGIDARAPSRADAARLAKAAADALKATAPVRGTSLKLQNVVVNDVSPVKAKEIVSGPRWMMAAGFAVITFALWCAAITLAAGLRRGLRSAPRRMADAPGVVAQARRRRGRTSWCRLSSTRRVTTARSWKRGPGV